MKELGQLAGTTTEAGETVMEFAITTIEPNFECTGEFASPSEKGNFIAITMEVQTTPAPANEDVGSSWISPHDFKVIGPDGTRENESPVPLPMAASTTTSTFQRLAQESASLAR